MSITLTVYGAPCNYTASDVSGLDDLVLNRLLTFKVRRRRRSVILITRPQEMVRQRHEKKVRKQNVIAFATISCVEVLIVVPLRCL